VCTDIESQIFCKYNNPGGKTKEWNVLHMEKHFKGPGNNEIRNDLKGG
jgi:hypothetical protein